MKLKNFTQTVTAITITATVTFGITEQVQAGVLGGSLTGSYNVGKTSYHLTDYSRKEIYTADETDYRELRVQFFYPTKTIPSGTSAPYVNTPVINKIDTEMFPGYGVGALLNSVQVNSIPQANIANNESKYPVLFFSHGLMELPEFYTSFMEQLASNGYIVATINHSYDALATELADGKVVSAFENNVLLPGIFNPEISKQATQIRAADAQFLLNELSQINSNDPENILTGKLDLDNVGIFGHSLGGATAAEAMRLDSRFKAGINMDGTLWTDVVNTGLDKPFMLMNGSNFDNTRQTFYNNSQGDKYNLTIKNAQHQNFSDKPLLEANNSGFTDIFESLTPGQIGTIDPQLNNQIINDYTLDFFNKYLKNKNAPLLDNQQENDNIKFTSSPKSVPEPSISIGLIGIFGLFFLTHPLRRTAKIK